MRNMMKSRIRLAGAVVAALGVVLAGSRPASATPSTLGFYPSTDFAADGGYHLDGDSYRVDNFSGDGFDTAGLLAGFGDKDKIVGRNEVGFDYVLSGLGNNNFGDRVYLNGKTQLFNNPDSGVRAVAGVWLLGTKDSGGPNVGYLLGSKAFKFGRIHLGVAHAFRNQGPGVDETYLQLGFDRPITSKLSFAADYYSGKSAISGVQPTLYYAVNDKASFGIGYFFNNEPTGGGDNDQLYLCFDYNFGGRRTSGANVAPVIAPN